MRADLHAHTTASDGSLSPSALVALALERDLEVLAVTDHDSVGGIAEAREAALGTPLCLVAGVELSAVHHDLDVHIIGYFVDETDVALLTHLEDLRDARLRRAESIVSALAEAGYSISMEQVLALADGGAVGRAHVARVLVNGGHAQSVSDAFGRLLGRGRPFYVAKDVRSPLEVLEVIRAAGGLSVLAHPGVTHADELIGPLVQEGLAGVEAYHAEHSVDQRAHYAAIAEELGLIATGGSDYHGPALRSDDWTRPKAPLGSVDLPRSDVERLLALAPPTRP